MSSCVAGLSRSSRTRSTSTSRRTIQVGRSGPSVAGVTLPWGNFERTAASSAVSVGVSGSGGARVGTDALLLRFGLLRPLRAGSVLLAVPQDLFLELEDAVDQPLRRRRATGDVDVDRDDLVDPLHHVVGTIEATRAGAGAHRDDP